MFQNFTVSEQKMMVGAAQLDGASFREPIHSGSSCNSNSISSYPETTHYGFAPCQTSQYLYKYMLAYKALCLRAYHQSMEANSTSPLQDGEFHDNHSSCTDEGLDLTLPRCTRTRGQRLASSNLESITWKSGNKSPHIENN